MYPLSVLYKNYLRDLNASYKVKVMIDDVEYSNSHIVDFTIENIVSLDEEFVLGSAIPSKLTLQLYLKSIIPPNAKVVPYLALTKDDVDSEWLPLGEFYVDNRERNGDVWTFTCYDKLVWADVPYISALSYPTTQQAVWDEICDSLNFDYDSSIVVNPNYQFQAGPAGFSKRQILGYIASANGSNLYVGKDGVLRFKRFSASDEPVFSFEPSDYMRVKQTNPLKTYTRVVVTYDTADGLTHEAGTGDENHTLHIENPFMTQQMTDDLLAQLNGFSYLPITMDSKGFPHLDQGDIISFGQDESTTWAETETTWEETEMRWDGIVEHKTIILHHVMSFKGGLKSKIEAPSVSEQRSEFVLPDTLTQQIKLVAKSMVGDAIQFDKPFYGINFSREEGFVVQREDLKSKVVLNSDEFTFYQGNNKALYFDAVNDRYVFGGLVEASEFVGGTITGSLIQTSADSYPRVVISPTSQLIEAAQSSNNKIGMSAYFGSSSSPALHFNSQGEQSFAYQFGETLHINALKIMRITSGLDILLRPTGFVDIGSWSKLRNSGSDQTLQQALNSKMDASSGYTGVVPNWDGANARLMFYNNGLLTDVQLT